MVMLFGSTVDQNLSLDATFVIQGLEGYSTTWKGKKEQQKWKTHVKGALKTKKNYKILQPSIIYSNPWKTGWKTANKPKWILSHLYASILQKKNKTPYTFHSYCKQFEP